MYLNTYMFQHMYNMLHIYYEGNQKQLLTTHAHIKSSKHVVGVIGCPIYSGYVHGMLSLEQRGGLQQKRLLLGVGLLQWPKDTPKPW